MDAAASARNVVAGQAFGLVSDRSTQTNDAEADGEVVWS
jgi:hypothetical protein